MVSSRVIFIFTLWASSSTFLLLLTINKTEGAKATEHVYVDYIKYKYNPKYTKNCTCKLNFINRMQKSFTSLCLITKPLDNVVGRVKLFYKFRNGYQLFLVDTIVNLCHYYASTAGSAIMDIFAPTLKKYLTSQNLTCPYVGRFDIRNLPLTGPLFNNMFLPVGNYMVNITITTYDNEFFWNCNVYFIIPEGKTIEDDRMGR